ncbi:hypothetical protein SAMN05192560_0663 [Methylobacillus rhizosphaerae]|uniref:Uncharacterized protein n=1 Tax=Methylobacillus rhizosphaerae TaxID=551994 RepID=A0A238YLA7_9PROT|nr:hypothetical protein SAMN05192560_0663 [Methylobacillus rhizosphaerae]
MIYASYQAGVRAVLMSHKSVKKIVELFCYKAIDIISGIDILIPQRIATNVC